LKTFILINILDLVLRAFAFFFEIDFCFLDLRVIVWEGVLLSFIELYFFKDISALDYDYSWNIFKRIYWRIKTALKILFKGRIYMDGSLTIRSEQHINDFIFALQEGQKKLKENIKKDDHTIYI
jgi:hypothetical protein